ncbi:S-layer homology domain-containing protein [Cohnella sp. GCM10020058]|uniref:S-layer homology domain-containing protein n=1 Tax=Cohnella sp. GCM10020058 TaxID=3317330 RepID=UPI003624B39C
MQARSMFRLLSRIKLQLLLAVALAIPPIAMAGTASAGPDSSGAYAGTLLASCEYKSDMENGDTTASCPNAISIGANEDNAYAGVLKFDLRGLSGTVLEADLKLYITANNADEEAGPELTIYQHGGNWTEPTTGAAAWPSYGSGLHARAVAVTERDGAWMTFNIASLVRDSINKGKTELVLVLVNMRWDAGGQRIFQFAASGTNNPKLDISYTTTPVQVPAPHTRIAAGDGFTLSLQDDGTVKAYGWINGRKIDVPDDLTGVQSVYASNACGYAIKTDGFVAALGDGCTVPAEASNGNVVGLVPEGYASTVLKNDGTITSLESGYYKMPEEWKPVYGPFKSVSGGFNHAAALTWDGNVVSWGSESMAATSVPDDLPETVAIASGVNHTLALLADGSVRLWGYWGVDRPPEDLPKAVAIGANENYSVVVTADGSVVVWGDDRLQPPAGLSGVVAVAAGSSHIVALKSDGTLVGWGNNQHGETVTPAPSVSGLSWSAGSEIGTTKASIADESLNDENYGELTLKYRIGAPGSVRHPYIGEDPADLGYDTELHDGDELTVPSGQHVYVLAEYEEKDEYDSTPTGIRKVAYWTDADPIVAVAPPEAPNVSADDASNTIVGLTTAMEFQVDDGAYVRYDGTNAPDLTGTHTVKVRVAADPATGTPAGAAATLSFTTNPPAPEAPSVSANDATNTIVGLTTAMEFQVDDGAYMRYDGTNAPDLSGTHTVKVRVAADPATGTPAGAAVTLSFTTNPPAPEAPSVSANDATNTIVGLTTAMEFQVDDGAYVKYDGSNAPDLSGTHTVKVRVAADPATGTPAGAAATLSFTTPSTYVPPTSTPSVPQNQGVDVLVNGKAESIGAATTSTRSSQTVTTVIVDEGKLEQKLAAEGQKSVLTIPVNKESDIVIGELSGRMVQSMEQKQATIEIKTEYATYTIPARQINIGAISEQLGKSIQLQDITIQIEVAAPNEDTVKRVESSAKNGGFSIVVPPVEFTIRAVSGDQKIEIARFEAYVERTIAIPDGVDPSKITTGIVVEPDGTVRHVPTQIVVVGNRYFAKINSLTNSTYSLVYNPIAFNDVDGHWAKTEVNDMGSRMVVNGTGDGLFNPDQAITRAEFAAIMVRGLGLKLADGATTFSDVKSSDWFSGAVQTMYQYKLIDGFEDGTFRPADTITREQAMKIIAQAMLLTGLESKLSFEGTAEALKPFADGNTTAEWAKAGVVDVIQAGIITGRSSTTLAPKANISRAEVAVMIRKLLQASGLI